MASKKKLAEAEEHRRELIAERNEKIESEKTPEQRAIDVRNLTVAERLRKGDQATIKQIVIKDDLGDILVPVRIPSMKTIREIQDIQHRMAGGFQTETVEDVEKLADRYCMIMGTMLCADPSMGPDYWKLEDYNPALPAKIIAGIMKLVEEDVEQGSGFRKDAKRPIAR